MPSTDIQTIVLELLSILPQISRITNRKLIKSSLSEFKFNITPLHFQVIRLLEEKRTLHVVEIGESLQISKAQTSQLLNKLVNLKLVERRIDSSDRRITNISLTNYGQSILSDFKIILTTSVSDTLKVLSNEKIERLSNALRTLNDILSQLPKN